MWTDGNRPSGVNIYEKSDYISMRAQGPNGFPNIIGD
jgi:hypothetical protein